MSAALDALKAEKSRLSSIDARHKRGFRLSERSPHEVLLHLIEELTEVNKAKTDDEREEEMGDCLGLLFCYAERVSIDIDAAARRALVKLKLDFPERCRRGFRIQCSGNEGHFGKCSPGPR